MKYYALLILGLVVLAGCAAPDNLAEQPQPSNEQASSGDLVVVEYVGTLASGEVFDATQEQPLEFVLGEGMILPAFEERITGMQIGEQQTFTLTAAEAYGERVEQTQEVPLEEFGEEQPEVGMLLTLIDPETQQPTQAQVIEVGEETATLDLNHPLAGEDLTFEVELVDIQEAPAQQGMPIEDIQVE